MQTMHSRWGPLTSFWLAGVVCACLLCEARAQTDKPARPVANRYLVVVETSRAMQHRLDGTLQVLMDLVNSGMAGQLERHDSIGVWTYNNELHAGQFPLQDWSPVDRTNIAHSVQGFIQAQKLEKKAQFDKVMPTLHQVVRGSEYITVIIISSGEAPLHGTSFDTRINDFYKTWRAQQQKAHMPFIAVLRAQKGQFADCSVSAAPWHPELPGLPAELLATRAARIAAVARKQTPAPLPPLIITGHKQPSEPVKPVGEQPLTAAPKPPDAAADATEPTLKPAPFASEKVMVSSSTSAPQPQTMLAATPATNTGPGAGLKLQNARANSSESIGALAPVTGQAAPSVHGSASAAHTANASPPTAASSLAESPRTVAPADVAAVSHNMGAGAQEPATTVSNDAPLYSKLLWFSIGLLVALAVLIFWRWREQVKAPVHISVITRSLERER